MDFVARPQDVYEGRTFRGLRCPGETIQGIEFYDCVFQACAFVEAIFKGCKFVGCAFRDCDLSLAQVPDSAFTETTFEGSKVVGVNWTDASWPRISGLDTIHFHHCTVNYSTFIGLNLKGLRLVNCVARDVDFADANLTGADCKGTDFAESRFSGTDLTGADFTGATHYAIDATLNTLKKTKFSLPEAVSLLRCLDIILVDPQEVDNPEGPA